MTFPNCQGSSIPYWKINPKVSQPEANFTSFWKNHRQEYQRLWINQKRALKKERDKEREKLDKRERNVDNFSSHTRSSLTFCARNKESFICWEGEAKKNGLVKRLDLGYLRLASQNKRAIKKCSNQPWFKEWLNKESLLRKYQEWSLRGGQKVGEKYLSFLDFDIEKEDLELWRKKQLRKNVGLLLNYLGCFYVETRKGFHIYLLTDELLPNEILYHVDSWAEREKIIGSIQSKGKYVVAFDSPNKKLIEKGQWFWHVKDLEQVKQTLNKFFLLVGKQNQVLKAVEHRNLLTKKSCEIARNQVKRASFYHQRYRVQAKILSKHKTCLADIWKVFYLDYQRQKTSYFLLNEYQRGSPGLNLGEVRKICLIQGRKHCFFSRLV